jgi:hypothetical protein
MQRWILPPKILATMTALLLAVFGSMVVPQPTAVAATPSVLPAATPAATPAPTPAPASTPTSAAAPQPGESGEGDGLDDLAQLNPPPQLSARSLGITTVPCDSAVALDDPKEVEGQTYYCGVFTVPQN